jgi:tRNA(adenine34) deaminase
MTREEKFMSLALLEAKKAAKIDEVPVGAVIVFQNKVIARGYNKRETKKNALSHAEIVAIDKACKKLGAWRLEDCEIYVTLEPCPMCSGAIINSRIKKVVFGAYDEKSGCCSSVVNLFDLAFNHKPEIIGGVLQDKCSGILSDFFKILRLKKSKPQ